MFDRISRKCVAPLVLAGLLIAGTATAGSYHHTPSCHYKTVTVWVTVKKPVVHYVKYYDCGRAYRKRIVRYETVRIPVTKKIRVAH